MNKNLKDILSQLPTDIDQETLLLYLQGKLPPEQEHEVEKELLENDFATDAVEGLQHFKDQQKLQFYVDQLNRDLKKRTARKKAYRQKLQLKTEPWLLTGLVIILILIVLCYIIIHNIMQQTQ